MFKKFIEWIRKLIRKYRSHKTMVSLTRFSYCRMCAGNKHAIFYDKKLDKYIRKPLMK